MTRKFLVLAILGLCLVQLRADDFPSTSETVGHSDRGLVTPVNQLVTPAGKLVELPGIRPQALVLSPDGKILVTAGITHELIVLDPASGGVLQHVKLPRDSVGQQEAVTPLILNPDTGAEMSFAGLAFSPDGSRVFLSNVNGDIKVFGVAKDKSIASLAAFPLPVTKLGGKRTNEIPAGIAVSPDGKKIYVAGNFSNRLFEMDAATGKILRTWDVGVAPLEVILCKNKIYVSNWGGRRPTAGDVTALTGEAGQVRADTRGIANEGSVCVIDLAQGRVSAMTREIVTGPHACALAVSPNGKYLVVASAGSDMLSVIDTHSDEVVETICARREPGDLFGAQPVALAFDRSGKTLFVANGMQNAVAVFQFTPRSTRMLGLIPAGWFPSSLVFDAKRDQLCVANLKDISTRLVKAKLGAEGDGFSTKTYAGTLSLVPLPSKKELAAMTQTVLMNLRYPLLAQSRLPARLDRHPVPVPERVGEASVFKHVIFVIKENRSYDQLFGDITEGNGDASLCSFGERVTPNQHKLVRDFALLDNTYCSGVLSADGHSWTVSGFATDYVEREFAGWPRSYPSGGFGDAGTDALAFSPAGFIWDNALAHDKSVHNFGEFCTSTKRWKIATRQSKIGFAETWKDYVTGANEIVYSCEPDIVPLGAFMEKDWPSWDLSVPDQWRATRFIERLKGYEKNGDMPALTILWLPNDHTDGTKPEFPTPAAMVADNDLAFGRIIEALSHSKLWQDTCVLAIEDDPQNGWDHVSGYRTTAYVISAWTKRHAVVHTQFNTTSILRTMELILGLPPMNQMDATATPMFDCFAAAPDFTPFDAVTNNVPLDEMNPSAKKIADAQQLKDALVSSKLPLDKPDQCDEDVLNRILWRATMGTKPYPEWAVKPVDDD